MAVNPAAKDKITPKGRTGEQAAAIGKGLAGIMKAGRSASAAGIKRATTLTQNKANRLLREAQRGSLVREYSDRYREITEEGTREQAQREYEFAMQGIDVDSMVVQAVQDNAQTVIDRDLNALSAQMSAQVLDLDVSDIQSDYQDALAKIEQDMAYQAAGIQTTLAIAGAAG